MKCSSRSRLALIAVLFGAVLLLKEVPASADQSDTPVILPASSAILNGTSVKFVQDHIESWTNRNDSLTWKAKVPAPGIYNVVMVYSSLDPGSLVEVSIGAQGVQGRLQKCLDWTRPCTQYLGQVRFNSAREITVNLSVIEMKSQWLMHLNELRLVPTGESEFRDPPGPATHPVF